MAKGRVFCYVTTDSWRVTVHCALLTMVSHTSWSHYSKVFFVKGKGGKRASRLSLAGCGRAPTRASRSSEETTEIDTEKKRNEREREPRHQHEHKHRKKRRAWARAGQDTRNKNWRQGQSWTRTQTPSRKHNILVAIRSLVLQFCLFFWVLLAFENFGECWKCRNMKNHEILILHSERNLDNWKLQSS